MRPGLQHGLRLECLPERQIPAFYFDRSTPNSSGTIAAPKRTLTSSSGHTTPNLSSSAPRAAERQNRPTDVRRRVQFLLSPPANRESAKMAVKVAGHHLGEDTAQRQEADGVDQAADGGVHVEAGRDAAQRRKFEGH